MFFFNIDLVKECYRYVEILKDIEKNYKHYTKEDIVANSIVKYNNNIIFAGDISSFRSGPTIKDQRNIYTNLMEEYKSYKDILIPHPQLTFNNFIPPFSGSIKVYNVAYSGKTPVSSFITKSNGSYIINEGYNNE